MYLSAIKEKSETYGTTNLSDIELLSILVGKNVVEIFNNHNIYSMDQLIGLSDLDLLKISSSKAICHKVKSFVELYKRKLKYEDNKLKISSPNEIYDNNRDMVLLNQEVFRLVCLDTKNRVIYKEDLFKGTLNSSIVHPREIFKQAINKNSASIVVIHNHPSGDSAPSNEDINITHRIYECGKIIGISVLDHIIIGKNNYCSLKERGIIN
ncbi:DNA repair protein RadC [Clostridium chromiireducens]|jgi:DNA repair protein radc|uniref:DNA repair protein RadC n=1 Tax=Clostridium chromiireducens TaxID=225345 RepID=A0A964W1Q3_9CLOT|nr:DNA repair protein RadC [Clostridium chromiireducens]MVX63711.1 DNA repair protein RadC [Clostridium chromiireducens]